MSVSRHPERRPERRRVSGKTWAEKHEKGFEPTALIIPEGVTMFKPKEGRALLDVIPFVTGNGNPDADPGMEHFCRVYWVHGGMGPDGKDSYCCPYWISRGDKNSKKTHSCPICEYISQNNGLVDEQILNKMKAKKRILINLIDRKDKDKGIQIWSAPWGGPKMPWFGQALMNKMMAMEEYQDFANVHGGYTLQVDFKKQSVSQGGKEVENVTNIEMLKRKEDLDEKLIDEASCLDACVKILSYEQLKEILMQGSSASDEDEGDTSEYPASGRDSSKNEHKEQEKEPEEEDEDKKEPTADELGIKEGMKVKHETHGVCTVIHVSKDGTSLRLQDDDDEIYRGIAPSECDLVKEEKKPNAKKPAVKEPEPEEEDDDWDNDMDENEDKDEEEEEKPTRKPGRPRK